MNTPPARLFMYHAWASLLLWLLIVILPAQTYAQVYQLAELNTEQIRALDHERTVVLLPGGILEEHGPYLPSFADGYYNEYLTDELAKAIADRPGWAAVVFPTIPLGSGGANEIGHKYAFPGTHAVRPATLRAVFMDLASEFGEQGFRWIFVIHAHGSPDHNRALDEAGDYFRDIYGGHMVHLSGLLVETKSDSLVQAAIGNEGVAANGFTVHAGVGEHSTVWYLRPDLVPPDIMEATPVTAQDVSELVPLAQAEDWPGYFGSPRHASAELGEQLLQESISARVKLALSILDGLDEREIPRYADFMYQISEINGIMERSRAHDAKRALQQKEWLERQHQARK